MEALYRLKKHMYIHNSHNIMTTAFSELLFEAGEMFKLTLASVANVSG